MRPLTQEDFERWRKEAEVDMEKRLIEAVARNTDPTMNMGVGLNWDRWFAQKVNEHFGLIPEIKPGE